MLRVVRVEVIEVRDQAAGSGVPLPARLVREHGVVHPPGGAVVVGAEEQAGLPPSQSVPA